MSERFHGCHWGQCLELLSHLCEYSDSILLVSGEPGIGKTTMKQALIEQESDQFVISDITATPNLTAEQLAIQIEQDFEDSIDKECLLLIDNAQNLALDVMAIILQIKQKAIRADRLHMVLFATPELEQKMARSVLKDDFAEQVHTIEIEPLTVAEVESFLIQQWRANKHTTDEMPLNRAKCKKIHALSGGIPARVQEIAAEMLEGRAIKTNSDQQSLSPFAVGVTVSFGILFCILAILWPTADKEMLAQTESTVQPLQIATQDQNVEDALIETAEFSTQPSIEPQPTIVVEQSTTTLTTPTAVALQTEDAPTTVNSVVIETPAVIVAADDVDQKIALLEKKVSDLQKQVDSEQKALRATETRLQQLLGTNKQPNRVAKAHKPASKTLALSTHEKKILSLPGANYTMQLLCMNKESQVKEFIRSNKLDNKAYYYKSHFKGKDWFIVVYGNYANKLDAQIAMSHLPASLKKLRPWVRDYVSVQQAITKRGN